MTPQAGGWKHAAPRGPILRRTCSGGADARRSLRAVRAALPVDRGWPGAAAGQARGGHPPPERVKAVQWPLMNAAPCGWA